MTDKRLAEFAGKNRLRILALTQTKQPSTFKAFYTHTTTLHTCTLHTFTLLYSTQPSYTPLTILYSTQPFSSTQPLSSTQPFSSTSHNQHPLLTLLYSTHNPPLLHTTPLLLHTTILYLVTSLRLRARTRSAKRSPTCLCGACAGSTKWTTCRELLHTTILYSTQPPSSTQHPSAPHNHPLYSTQHTFSTQPSFTPHNLPYACRTFCAPGAVHPPWWQSRLALPARRVAQ